MTKPAHHVLIARPSGRPFQLRYKDPATGKPKRLSVGSRDEAKAKQMKAELEAKLLLGLKPTTKEKPGGPPMAWSDFRDRFSAQHVATLRSENSKRLGRF